MNRKEYFYLCKNHDRFAVNSDDISVATKSHNESLQINSHKLAYPDIYDAYKKGGEMEWIHFAHLCYKHEVTANTTEYCGPFNSKKEAVEHARMMIKGKIEIYEAIEYQISIDQDDADELLNDIQSSLINAVLKKYGRDHPQNEADLTVVNYGISMTDFISKVMFSNSLFEVGDRIHVIPPVNTH